MHRRPLATALLGALLLAGCQRGSVEQLRAEAVAYQQRGETQAALIQLKNALEIKPGDADIRFLMATMYNDSGEVQSAEKEIRKAIEYGYPDEKALPVLVLALLLQGQFQKILDETASANDDPQLLCLRGDAWLGLGKTEEARKAYEAVLASKPNFSAALIGQGKLAYLDGDSAGARDWARRALLQAPNDTDALMFEADLARAQQESATALARYDRVIALRPAHRSAHIEKAFLLISLTRYAEAQKEITAALRNTPGSLLVTYAQALLDFSEGRLAPAHEALQHVLRVFPEHMPSVLLAGAVSYNLGYLHQAEQHLRTYLAKIPANEYARQLLAATLLKSGQSPDALAVLEPSLKAGGNMQTLALAGESYMQVREFTKASELFTRATELQPQHAPLRTSLGLSKLGAGDKGGAVDQLEQATRLDARSLQASIALAQTELDLKHVDRALAVLAEAEKNLPGSPAVQDLKGQALQQNGEPAKARASYARALELQPSYFPAASRLMQMELAGGKPDLARQHIERFLEHNKTHLDAMTAMAGLADSAGNAAETTQWLERASIANPQSVPAYVRLISQYLLTRQTQKALTLASKLQVDHPRNPDLLDLLGKSQLANGEMQGALESYKKLVFALPLSAQAQMQVAALLLIMDRPSEAEDYLKNALALQPDFPAAQLAMAELHVRKGRYDIAQLISARLQRSYPKASAGYQLEGDILLSQGKPADALRAFDKGASLAPSSELAIKAAHALRQSGQRDAAAKRLAQWMQAHPKDTRVELFIAETALADGAFALAAQRLEALLRGQPDNATALNNLAWAYQQLQDQRATATAERAAGLAPEKPAVLDTYGWILVEGGDLPRGLATLRKASTLAPAARDIRYHLAVALAHSGDKAGAREQLEYALRGDDRFPQAAEARALAQQLK